MKQFEKRNPRTGEVLKRYPIADALEVEAAIAKARMLVPVWRETSLSTRRLVLKTVVQQIHQQLDALATQISLETGKPLQEAIQGDLLPAVGILDYTAEMGPRLLRDRLLPFEKGFLMGRVHTERRIPRGVVGVISPWNFPFAIPISGVSAALMGGNPVVLKPSELTPGVGELVVSLFQTALEKRGFPPELVQVLQGDGSTGAALVQGDIDYGIFTGSEGTGAKVRAALQARGKGVSLELGGSDPMIILEGADLEAAAAYALWGRFSNSGQACAAVKRLFIPQAHQENFVQILKAKIEAFCQNQACLTPLISEQQRQVIVEQVQDALARGARIITGGMFSADQAGWYYPWTVLVDVPPEARVLQEEVFGPVLPVMPYTSVEEAVQFANTTTYGLGGSVFGPGALATAVAKQIEAGMVVVNDVATLGYALPAVPWQGWKQSGPGVSHGPSGILETTQLQILTRNYLYHLPLFRKQPWHFGLQPDIAFAKTLLRAFGGESVLQKLNPRFLWGLFRHRSSKKL